MQGESTRKGSLKSRSPLVLHGNTGVLESLRSSRVHLYWGCFYAKGLPLSSIYSGWTSSAAGEDEHNVDSARKVLSRRIDCHTLLFGLLLVGAGTTIG